jgi:hypothetical protein
MVGLLAAEAAEIAVCMRSGEGTGAFSDTIAQTVWLCTQASPVEPITEKRPPESPGVSCLQSPNGIQPAFCGPLHIGERLNMHSLEW